MKAPVSDALIRYYRQWNLPDIFATVAARDETITRPELQLGIDGLVGKRNGIAHGDLSVEATQSDIEGYLQVSRVFVAGADAALGEQLAVTLGSGPPW